MNHHVNNFCSLLCPAGSAEDERRVSPAPGVHCERRCGAGGGSAETGTASPLMRAMLWTFRAARLHCLLTIHKDEQRPCLFGTQSPAHYRYHHPQRWVKLTTVITSLSCLLTLILQALLFLTPKAHLLCLPKIRSRGDMAQDVNMLTKGSNPSKTRITGMSG